MQCLQKNIEEKDSSSRVRRLPTFSDVRWIDRHDAVMLFKQFLPEISDSLQEITSWSGKEDNMASTFFKSIDSEFLVAITVMEAVLACTRPVAKFLQTPSIDLKVAIELVDNLLNMFLEWRASSDTKFTELFNDCKGMFSFLIISI
jgi:hypothetical protein